MDNETRQDLRTELVKLKFKSGDGSEVAAAATERPKQIRIFRRAGTFQLPVGCYDIGRQKIVYRQAELPRDPAESSAQRQTSDTGGRVDPVGTANPYACVSLSTSASVAPGSTRAL